MGKGIAALLIIVFLIILITMIWALLTGRKHLIVRKARRARGKWEPREIKDYSTKGDVLRIEAIRGEDTVLLTDPIRFDSPDFNGRLYEARLEADQKLLALNDRKR